MGTGLLHLLGESLDEHGQLINPTRPVALPPQRVGCSRPPDSGSGRRAANLPSGAGHPVHVQPRAGGAGTANFRRHLTREPWNPGVETGVSSRNRLRAHRPSWVSRCAVGTHLGRARTAPATRSSRTGGGPHKLGVDADPKRQLPAAFTELAVATYPRNGHGEFRGAASHA